MARYGSNLCPSTDEQIKKMVYIYIYIPFIYIYINGIFLSPKKNEILPFATTWMDLGDIRLSEISQTDKDK